MRRREARSGSLGIPLGTLLPHRQDDTEPVPLPDSTEPIPLPARPVPQVRAVETCGPCGSSFEVDWVGRTDTLTVIREWRSGHRCRAPLNAPDIGTKAALIEGVGFTPE